ncbi:hypothetical protein SERLA73DRAFT_163920 [Serpula lacrymans var. lacrymans S7.3]|uniref:NmrA-like domain-containing protein n=2 Tax=Serpula lacrymans var. lacrymans TaxID=341189 RepID=F8QG74_SERL3|nr:uncharacterized protein SERLADRAFT_442925 [Serpula lacrymans var. lacrymans S7.9]EGN92689.1 hypothetical protein SERLA73DRAFT_163920 [Serpula lacrymans var. lacrymans S7.3]EGO19447.1 hypothetical protein SERLADRAFT_442925 [Serpula lacrymans var. lacrymans S7.9]
MADFRYTSFAVAGAGPTIGLRIVKALLARNASVLILTRLSRSAASPAPSATPQTHPSGAQVASVDYTDIASVSSVLRAHNVQVVVSAFSFGGLEAQRPLADAAKEAGVTLFVPSEYGMVTEGGKEGHLIIKSLFAEYLKSINLPSTRVYNGMLMEFVPWLAGVPQIGKFLIAGKGDKPASFTSLEDVSGFVAHVLTTLSPSALHDKSFRIQGERTTLNAIGALYASANKASVEYVDKLPDDQGDFTKQAFLQGNFEAGKVSTGWDNVAAEDNVERASSANALWEGHHWISVKEALGL